MSEQTPAPQAPQTPTTAPDETVPTPQPAPEPGPAGEAETSPEVAGSLLPSQEAVDATTDDAAPSPTAAEAPSPAIPQGEPEQAQAPAGAQTTAAGSTDPVSDAPAPPVGETDSVQAPAGSDAASHAATAPAPTILAGDSDAAHTDPSTVEQAAPAAQREQDPAPVAGPGMPDVDHPAPPIAAASRIPSPGGMPVPASAPTAAPTAPVPAAPASATPTTGAASFGRVAEDGTVYVRTADGEREVGSYPGAGPQEALAYFTRKYEEVSSLADLLHQRVTQTDLSSKDATEGLTRLRETVSGLRAVGDLAALEAKVETIAVAVEERRGVEAASRAAARTEALATRERIVVEAETLAAQPEEKVQWKASSGRMRALLDEWKAAQRSGPKLDRDVEQALWHRLSSARNSFDKMRRVHFAALGQTQAEAKTAKEELVAEAEQLATSTDWGATAGAFKRLMDRWRQAGRASRADDDALWQRFKAAQDRFFAAKDEVVAAENEEYTANLAVKEELLAEGQSILPVTDLDAAKKALRALQDKWDAAGKVPRSDMDRIEKGMRRIEQAVRDAEDKKWKQSDPEVAARARSLATQLEAAVADLRDDLAKAEAGGNERKIAKAKEALEAREAWLAQARAGLEEFGG